MIVFCRNTVQFPLQNLAEKEWFICINHSFFMSEFSKKLKNEYDSYFIIDE